MTTEQPAVGQNVSSILHGVRIARVSTVPFFVAAQLKHQIAIINKHSAHVTTVTSEGVAGASSRVNEVIAPKDAPTARGGFVVGARCVRWFTNGYLIEIKERISH